MLLDRKNNKFGHVMIITTDVIFISYAFVEFEDAKDAEDALQEMHGRNIDGNTFIINVS